MPANGTRINIANQPSLKYRFIFRPTCYVIRHYRWQATR